MNVFLHLLDTNISVGQQVRALTHRIINEGEKYHETYLHAFNSSSKQIAEKLMGRRRWQHYQQLLMENVHLKDEDRQMEEKDWESSDKYNFCDENSNTSQQTVDNIVPESEEQPKTKNHSSESSYETENSEEEILDSRNHLNFRRSQFPTSNIPESFYFPKNKLNSMSSLDSVASSVAASMAAVAAITNITGNLPKSFGDLRFPSGVAAADVLPQWYNLSPATFKMENVAKRDEREAEASDEQPLDLSAKASSPLTSPRESPEVPSPVFPTQTSFSSHPSMSPSKVSVFNSNRHIFKAKPRLSPMTGRRTYTEEELQAALRDIQSGKVGTRRAAVLYGIPRSTLRNKVYKLTLEKERDKSTILQSLAAMDDRRTTDGDADVPSDDKEELEERENEEEEEEDAEKELSPVEEEKDERNFMKPTFTVDDLIRLSKQTTPIVENDSLRALFEQTLKHEKDSPASAVPLPPPLYSIFPPGASEIWGNLDAASIAPYLTHLMAATRDSFSVSSLLAHPNPYFNLRNQNSSNESPTDIPPSFGPKFSTPLLPELVQKMLAESEEQRKREALKVAKSAASGAGSFSSPPIDTNQEEISGSSILRRLPFFKSSYKNGSTSESGFGNASDYNADNRMSEGSEKSVTSSPPPLNAPRSESSSPLPGNNKGLNLREVISKAMSSRYQQPGGDVGVSHMSGGGTSIEGLHRVSFPSLTGNSVIKSHSSMTAEDRSKSCNQPKVPLPSSSAGASSASGGKGTRPKRGKYRNYDRDSLVEAVRAVQRGEMSVHRAGSFYGVPHSTLEYKVKERHLMRPRKREPKNQSDELKRREDGSVLRLSSVNEKTAQHSPSSQPKVSKSPFTPPSSHPTTPNGLKIPALFDAAHPFAPTTPFPFWPAPFHQLAMDYSRGSTFPTNPEHLLASHFVQRIQEESAKSNQLAPNLAALSKNARQMAESLYDGSGINGSFLDGVIRSSLDNDQTFGDIAQKKQNLLEQLYKNKYLNANSKQNDESDDESAAKPNLNQILAQTLLSSVAASKDRSSSFTEESALPDEKNETTAASSVARSSSTSADDECDKGRPDGMCVEDTPQKQSLNLQVESHAVNMEVKSEKN